MLHKNQQLGDIVSFEALVPLYWNAGSDPALLVQVSHPLLIMTENAYP